MAGSNPDFNASEFRNAIRTAMTMGLPNTESEQATFRWADMKNYSSADSGGNPWSWTADPTSDATPDPVQVEVAIEFHRGASEVGRVEMGQFDSPRVTITILDEEYEQVEGAHFIDIGGDTYVVDYVTPLALFEVDVFQIHATALDET